MSEMGGDMEDMVEGDFALVCLLVATYRGLHELVTACGNMHVASQTLSELMESVSGAGDVVPSEVQKMALASTAAAETAKRSILTYCEDDVPNPFAMLVLHMVESKKFRDDALELMGGEVETARMMASFTERVKALAEMLEMPELLKLTSTVDVIVGRAG